MTLTARRFFSLILLACIASAFPLAGQQSADATQQGIYNAVADSAAVVTNGHARFTVLTPQLVRMEWSADGKFEDRPSFIFLNRNLPVPQFHVSHDGNSLVLQTSALSLTYKPSASPDGRFTPEDLSIDFKVDAKIITWRPGLKDTGNLLGTSSSLDRADGDKLPDPMQPGLISRDGWALVDDTSNALFTGDDFSFKQGEKSSWPWEELRAAGDRQDWYFFGYGHDYRQALSDYTKVAGKIPLPPRYIFGAWWTRYWPYTDQDILGLVKSYHQNDIPLDVMVIDMDWHLNSRQLLAMKDKYPTGFATKDTQVAPLTNPGQFDASGARLGWTGYTWDKVDFPYPADFLGQLHREGVKVTLNLHPGSGVMPWEKAYPEMARAMGIDPATQQFVKFDMLSQKYAQNYFDILHHPLEKEGVDFWWLDWQPLHEVVKTPGVNSTFWLNYMHFTDQQREGKRPMLFGRWGGLGNHRYETGFSGDVIIGWDSLAFQPYFTATAANVGYAYISHDIGGHIPGPTEPELYTRWVQWGAFSPVLRTHAAINPWGERRIWAYPEPYSDIMKDVFRDRYALIPYIYTEARRTYDTGIAFLRPLYYNWPEAKEAYDYKNEYQFGEEMLVAPVTQPVNVKTQLADIKTWVPKGDWIEATTGQHFAGPKTVEAGYSLDEIPRYVTAGAIVPMAPPMLSSDEKPVDPLMVQVYPMADGQQSSYTLYADGGDAEKYKAGEAAWTKLTAERRGPELTLHVAAISGTYPGMPQERGYQLRLPDDWPPQSVTVNGKPLTHQINDQTPGWIYDGNHLMTIVTTPRMSIHKSVEIKVVFAPELSAQRCRLEGLPGVLARLHQAELMMTDEQPIAQPPDELMQAKEMGERLTFHPETARQEVADFLKNFPLILPAVQKAQSGADAKIPKAVEHIVPDKNSAEFRDHAAAYANRISGSIAAIEDAQRMLPPCAK